MFAQWKEALGYLMFLKQKCCGNVKDQGCVDGCKQQLYIPTEDTTSPTIKTEAVFLAAVIDTMENLCVAIMDVPGTFMQVDMDETVHVHFTGEMVHMLLEIDMDLYQEYITIEQGEKVMFVKLLKALYSTLKAA